MRYLILVTVLLNYLTITAQTYKLTHSSETYQNLVGSTSLNEGFVWDDPDYKVPFGFTFNLFGRSITNIYVDDFGLGAYLSHSTVDTGIKPLIIAYGPDIIDRGYDVDHTESDVSYLTVGSVGSRILKIEWRNFGFYGDLDANDTCTDYGNLQIWFYEGSNTIEMRFGPNLLSQPILDYEGLPGPFMGLIDAFNFNTYEVDSGAYFVSGSPSSPVLSYSDTISFIDGDVPNGAVYHFYIPNSGISTIVDSGFKVFPNPATHQIHIVTPGSFSQHLRIRNNTGVLVREIVDPGNSIDVSDLAKGLYIMEIESDAGSFVSKVVLD